MDCGPVDGANGQVGLIAEDTQAGTVGCVEAINVMTEYLADAPTKGEGTAYVLTVDGWRTGWPSTPSPDPARPTLAA